MNVPTGLLIANYFYLKKKKVVNFQFIISNILLRAINHFLIIYK